MARIRIQQTIDAPPADVWRHLADIADHVTWMVDAASIRFTGDRRTGIGTTFECETRVGPLRTCDVMEVTEWREGEAIGVRHRGLITGTGRFLLAGEGDSRRSTVVWDERLRFPWWLGGPVGALVAAPVLRIVWRGNLRRLAARVVHRSRRPSSGDEG